MSRNDKTDALIVFTAWKYSRAVLVTADGGLLRKAEALKTAVGAQIMSARDLVNLLRKCIESRDRRARVESARTGLPVPTWVDQD